MMRIRSKNALPLILAVVFTSPAHSQTAQSGALEEIIVTAQRRAESINKVGMSIQAIDADSLEALRVTSVRDLTTRERRSPLVKDCLCISREPAVRARCVGISTTVARARAVTLLFPAWVVAMSLVVLLRRVGHNSATTA